MAMRAYDIYDFADDLTQIVRKIIYNVRTHSHIYFQLDMGKAKYKFRDHDRINSNSCTSEYKVLLLTKIAGFWLFDSKAFSKVLISYGLNGYRI